MTVLCIAPGKAVWAIYIDAVVLSDDGNVLDAAALAADAALRDARLPALRWDSDANVAQLAPDQAPIALVSRSNALKVKTAGVFEGKGIVDPDSFEEELCSALATVATADDGRLRYLRQIGSADGLLAEM